MKLLVPYPSYVSLTVLLQTLIYSVGLGQQVVCRYGRPTTDNNNNVVHCSCYLKYHGELCEKEPSCNLHCENAGKVRADCTCSCQQAFAGKYCEKNICPAVEHKSCSGLKKDSCGFSEVFPFCPYLCDTCQETQRPKCDEDALCHVSSYGCRFYGVRPTDDMCKTLGESGRDSAICDKKQAVADNCRECDNDRLGFRYRCPVLCGICPDPDTNTAISSTESSVKSKTSHRTSSTEKKTNATLGHKQTDSKTSVTYPAIIGALLAVVFTSGAIIVFVIVWKKKKFKRGRQESLSQVSFRHENPIYSEPNVRLDRITEHTTNDYSEVIVASDSTTVPNLEVSGHDNTGLSVNPDNKPNRPYTKDDYKRVRRGNITVKTQDELETKERDVPQQGRAHDSVNETESHFKIVIADRLSGDTTKHEDADKSLEPETSNNSPKSHENVLKSGFEGDYFNISLNEEKLTSDPSNLVYMINGTQSIDHQSKDGYFIPDLSNTNVTEGNINANVENVTDDPYSHLASCNDKREHDVTYGRLYGSSSDVYKVPFKLSVPIKPKDVDPLRDSDPYSQLNLSWG